MKVKPLRDLIIVKRSQENGKSPGGIIIPESAHEKPVKGTVVSVGLGKYADDEVTRIPIAVTVGDTVLFSSLSGSSFEDPIDGSCRIMREDEILGKVVNT